MSRSTRSQRGAGPGPEQVTPNEQCQSPLPQLQGGNGAEEGKGTPGGGTRAFKSELHQPARVLEQTAQPLVPLPPTTPQGQYPRVTR